MEMATTQTLFCRMDYQNGSVWRNEQDEAGRLMRKRAEAERLENGRLLYAAQTHLSQDT